MFRRIIRTKHFNTKQASASSMMDKLEKNRSLLNKKNLLGLGLKGLGKLFKPLYIGALYGPEAVSKIDLATGMSKTQASPFFKSLYKPKSTPTGSFKAMVSKKSSFRIDKQAESTYTFMADIMRAFGYPRKSKIPVKIPSPLEIAKKHPWFTSLIGIPSVAYITNSFINKTRESTQNEKANQIMRVYRKYIPKDLLNRFMLTKNSSVASLAALGSGAGQMLLGNVNTALLSAGKNLVQGKRLGALAPPNDQRLVLMVIELKRLYPELSEIPNDKFLDILKAIRLHGPDLMLDNYTLGQLVKSIYSYGGMSLDTIDKLISTEANRWKALKYKSEVGSSLPGKIMQLFT